MGHEEMAAAPAPLTLLGMEERESAVAAADSGSAGGQGTSDVSMMEGEGSLRGSVGAGGSHTALHAAIDTAPAADSDTDGMPSSPASGQERREGEEGGDAMKSGWRQQ